MPWPTPQDYNEAIQTPRLSLCDPELQGGQPDLSPLGLPRPITGNFASVYRLRCGAEDWAVRCFWREYADMQQRYEAISRHLAASALPYVVPCVYQPAGIVIRGQSFPLLKMRWLQGMLLNEYVGRQRHDRAAMQRLAEQCLAMARALERAGVAHGDLQHGNILVVGEELRLVDYDGMFVPALAGLGSHESGHPNYQHPARGADFDPRLDRFSAWLIYLSLLALAADPSLWDRFGQGEERLLFHRTDLEQPQRSLLVDALGASPDPCVRDLSVRLVSFLGRSPLDIPSLASGLEPRKPGLPSWLQDVVPADCPAPAAPIFTRVALPVAPLALSGAILSLLFGGPLLSLSFLACSALCMTVLEVGYRRLPGWRARRTAQRELQRTVRRRRRQERALERAERRYRQVEERSSCRLERGKRRANERQAAWQEVWDQVDREMRAERQALDEAWRRSRGLTLAAVQECHTSTILRSRRLLSRRGPTLSWLERIRLRLAGIATAHDVTRKLVHLEEAGHEVQLELLRWRAACDAEARASQPRALPPAVEAVVDARYAGVRRTLRRTETLLARQAEHFRLALAASEEAHGEVYQVRLRREAARHEDIAASLGVQLDDLARQEAVARWRLTQVEAGVWRRQDYMMALLGSPLRFRPAGILSALREGDKGGRHEVQRDTGDAGRQRAGSG